MGVSEHAAHADVLLSGVWVFLNMLPTLIVNSKEEDEPLGARDYAGWTLWTIGFLLEAVADLQKSTFRANPDNAVSGFS